MKSGRGSRDARGSKIESNASTFSVEKNRIEYHHRTMDEALPIPPTEENGSTPPVKDVPQI